MVAAAAGSLPSILGQNDAKSTVNRILSNVQEVEMFYFVSEIRTQASTNDNGTFDALNMFNLLKRYNPYR